MSNEKFFCNGANATKARAKTIEGIFTKKKNPANFNATVPFQNK